MFYIVFAILVFTALFFDKNKVANVPFWILLILGVIFVGFRGDDVDNDYQSYLSAIFFSSGIDDGIKEISFYLIRDFALNVFQNPTIVFLIYAILGVSSKLFAIKRLSNYFWVSVLLYFSTALLLQEFNTIRAGVAEGFFLLSIPYWGSNKFIKTLPFIILAVFFHYSFLILLPLLIFVRNDNKYLYIFVILIPVFYMLNFFMVDYLSGILNLLDIAFFQEKKDAYLDNDYTLSPFSTVFLLKITLIYIFYFFRRFFEKTNEYFYLLLKLYIVGLLVVIVTAKLLPTLGQRVLEIFVILEIFLIPLLLNTKFKILSWLFIICFATFYLVLYLELAKYVQPYHTIF